MSEIYSADILERKQRTEEWLSQLERRKESGDISHERYQREVVRAFLARDRLVDREKKKSGIDKLTQVPNRRRFEEELTKEIEQARRNGNNLGLLFLDIDHFKKFNDLYGHLTGNRCLRFVARCANSALRSSDFLARVGGEEFAVILVGVDNLMAAGERFRNTIAAEKPPDIPENVTVSVGCTLLRSDDTPEVFLNRADQAMYASKNSGRNQTNVI